MLGGEAGESAEGIEGNDNDGDGEEGGHSGHRTHRKLFECDVCNMKFSNGANMRRHKVISLDASLSTRVLIEYSIVYR